MAIAEKLITEHLDTWSFAIKQKSSAGRGAGKGQEFYGIKKLRELILELAVRGLLVPQDPNDEPASELLKKINKEKCQLASEKKIKKPKKLPAISDDEINGSLPRGWEYVRLNDLGEWGAGATPRRGDSGLYGGEIPWFKSGELVGNYISESEETVTELALQKSSLRYNKPGDVLLAMYGATIGKTSILSVAATTNQAVCACTPFSGFSNIFLLTLLKAYKPRFIGMGAGGAQPNISREKIINTVIALPPTAEQHRIVAKVDELMALCDQLELRQEDSLRTHQTLVKTLLGALTTASDADRFSNAWKMIESNFDTLFTTESSIDELKQTILQLAVMGKLVPQNPNDEPASELLKKIAAEKERLIKDKKIRKPKKLPLVSDVELAFYLPPNWEWTLMGTLCHVVADGPHFSPQYVDEANGIPFLSGRNINVDSIDLSTVKYVSKEDHEEFCKRVKPELGDILYTKGGTTGIAKVNDLDLEFSVWVHVAVLKIPNDKVHDEYMALALNSPHCYEQSQKYTHGIGNKDLGLTRMIMITIPLPPIAEQKRIVAKVDELIALCDRLKARLKTAQETQLHLADTLVESAIQ
ncbi:restriction endonuclease subunit S [Pontiellaceae bacterium B12227]|nr:restriction endonuclease subunit S [Pontiellaceae bacterium B12227]